MRCNELMNTNPECIGPDTTVRDAARRMQKRNVGFLPVCGPDGRVEGVVTDRDVCCRIVAEDKPNDSRVGDFMTANHLVTVRPEDDLHRAQQLMSTHKVSRVLVCSDDGHLKGVISLSDIAQVADPAACAHTLKNVASRETVPAR